MALILAVDPGFSQAAAIERLARELHEHELVSAESCADALAVIAHRVPDLVLLAPLLPEAEEAELRSRLHAASGNVCTLTIPLLASKDPAPAGRSSRWFGRFGAPVERSSTTPCDPRVFAAEIREYLAAVPEAPPPEERALPDDTLPDRGPQRGSRAGVADRGPHRPSRAGDPERRAQVLAAASAAASWVRARRATWTDADVAPAPPPAVSRPDPIPEPARTEPPATAVALETTWPPPAPAQRPSPIADHQHEPARKDTPAVPIAAAADRASVTSPTWEMTVAAEPVRVETPVIPPARPSRESKVAAATRTPRVAIARWMPPRASVMRWMSRAAAVLVVVALAMAGRAYWPKLRATLMNGTAVLESVPAGSQVIIDGQLAGTTPITTELPAGRHAVEFRRGNSSRTMEVVVVARGRVVQRMDWTAKPTGSLQVSSDPTGARVLVDGELRGATPLKLDGLAVGTHGVTLEGANGTVRRTVKIAAGETAQVTELIFTGSLKVFSPFEVQMSERNRPIQLDDGGQVMLPPGPHELRFQNRELGYDEIRRVEIKPAATAALSLVPPPTTISVTATERAEVWADGKRIGETPLADAPVTLGTREIIVKTAAGDQRRFVVTATVKPVQLDVDFSKPQF